jgi:hypothetical protein
VIAAGSVWTSGTFWTAVGSVAIAITAVLAMLAAAFAYFQIRGLRTQLRVSANQGLSQLYGQVSSLMFNILDTLERNPKWIDYFYYGVPAPPAGDRRPDRELRLQLNNLCGRYLDLVDGVVEQRHTQPRLGAATSMDWSTWDAYFRFVYRSSPVLREYVRENLDFYPDYLFAALGYVVVRDPASGAVWSRWVAREIQEDQDRQLACRLFGDAALDEGISGYPWIRSWLFHADDERWVRGSGEEGHEVTAALATVTDIHPGPRRGRCAEVRLRWRGTLPASVDEAVRQWLAATLSSGRQLTRARFTDGAAGGGNPREYDLLAPDPPVEPSYLAPRYRTSGGRRRG